MTDMVPRQEMLDALSKQRQRLGRENDDELILINTMRERLWELFEAASAVDRFDWSSEGLDEDADAAMCRLQTSVRAIKRGVFPSQSVKWVATHGKEPDGWTGHDFIWIVWNNGDIECIECYGSIAWQEISHYQPVTAPNPPNEVYR